MNADLRGFLAGLREAITDWGDNMRSETMADLLAHVDRIEQSLSVAQGQGFVMEGWALVPREPTHQMKEAGAASVKSDAYQHRFQHESRVRIARNAYVSMISAASGNATQAKESMWREWMEHAVKAWPDAVSALVATASAMGPSATITASDITWANEQLAAAPAQPDGVE